MYTQHVLIAFAGLLARTSHAMNSCCILRRIAAMAVAIEQDLQVFCPRHDKTGVKVLGGSGIVSGEIFQKPRTLAQRRRLTMAKDIRKIY